MIVLEKDRCFGWCAIRDARVELAAPAWSTKRWTDLAQWVAQKYPAEPIGILVDDDGRDEVTKVFNILGISSGSIVWFKL
jgi:hypothetical protein